MKRTTIALLAALSFPLAASASYTFDPQAAASAIRAQANATDSMQDLRDQQRAEAEAAGRARNEAAAAERARVLEARNSPAGHIQGAEQQIRYCTARIAQARDVLKQDDEVAKVSGVTNLALRHEAGAQIVYCREQIDVAWREYRQYGGTEASPSALTAKLIADAQRPLSTRPTPERP